MRVEQAHQDVAQVLSMLEHDDDPRKGLAEVDKRIERYRAAGDEVPEVLINMRRSIERDMIIESQGR